MIVEQYPNLTQEVFSWLLCNQHLLVCEPMFEYINQRMETSKFDNNLKADIVFFVAYAQKDNRFENFRNDVSSGWVTIDYEKEFASAYIEIKNEN